MTLLFLTPWGCIYHAIILGAQPGLSVVLHPLASWVVVVYKWLLLVLGRPYGTLQNYDLLLKCVDWCFDDSVHLQFWLLHLMGLVECFGTSRLSPC